MGFVIRSDYHAYHHSGNRPLSAIDWLVLHDMENANLLGAAEGTGSWFENAASAGSTHYGIDNDTIQRYLSLNVIAWGAPNANQNGVHIEQMGLAAWSRAQWLTKATPTLNRAGWLLAHLQHYLADNGIAVPLRHLTDSEVKAHKRGIVTHRQLTRVLGGSHTDPGTGYPLDYVLKKAQAYAA